MIGVFVGPCWTLIVAMWGGASSYSASNMQKFNTLTKEQFIENQGKMVCRQEHGSNSERK